MNLFKNLHFFSIYAVLIVTVNLSLGETISSQKVLGLER